MEESQDAIWKEAIAQNLQEFMAFCFPSIYQDLDWEQTIIFLEQELLQILPDDEQGKQITDLLVQLHRRNGEERYFLIHIEVQGYYQAHFARRLFMYNVRLMLRYKEPVVSLVVYTDNNPNFRPSRYQVRYWNFYHDFGFPIAKLLDYGQDWNKLEAEPNPFAAIVMAQLKMHELEGAGKIEERAGWKLRLLRQLVERGLSRERIVSLFRFISPILSLPQAREEQFEHEAQVILEGGEKMPLLSPFEKLAKREGRQEGRQEGQRELLILLLEARFGRLESQLTQVVNALSSEQLEALVKAQVGFASKDELVAWLSQNPAKN